MSALRRRVLERDGSSSASRTPSPAPTEPSQEPDKVSVPIDKLNKLNQHIHHVKHRKDSKHRNAWIFGLGGIFGVLIAFFFVQSSDVVDLAYFKQMNLDTLLDVLPAGLLQDAQDLQVGRFLRVLALR